MILMQGSANAFTFSRPLEDVGRDGKVAKYKFTLHDSFVPTSIAWSGDGKEIATSSLQSDEVHIWDLSQKKIIKILAFPVPPHAGFHTLAWSPDGKFIATCTSSPSERPMVMRVWNTKDWFVAAESKTRNCHTLKFSSDSKYLVVAYQADSKDKHYTFPVAVVISSSSWVVEKIQAWEEFKFAEIHDIAFLPDGAGIVFAYGQPNFKYDKEFPLHQGGVLFGSISGKVGNDNDFMQLFRPPHGSEAISIAVNRTTEEIAVGSYKNMQVQGKYFSSDSVRIVDIKKRLLLATPLDGNEYGRQYGLAYTSNGKYLIAGSADYRLPIVSIISTESRRVVDTVSASGAIHALATQKDGNLFAVSSSEDIAVWEIK
ncbi:WD40 repeat domain-containing protein [Aquitalea sp.]|uniref:WD40 repeat domain-containing protein n=1 Tax=Aquitalea sp. TaxID=1872623 RepID=UPI00258B7EC3|nr:WD40 repeat domain-containing protein [Aquitalea sp.]